MSRSDQYGSGASLSMAIDSCSRNIIATAKGAVISDVLGVGVVDVEGKAAGCTLAQGELECVVGEVVRISSTQSILQAAVLWERGQHLANGQCAIAGCCIGRSSEECRIRRSRQICIQDSHVRRGGWASNSGMELALPAELLPVTPPRAAR